MLFSEASFLCWFLPAVLMLYWLTPSRLQNLMLLLASLYFYAYGERVYILIMLASIVLNYTLGFLVADGKQSRSSRVWIVLAIVFNLSLLAFYKYANFAVENLNLLFANFGVAKLTIERVPLPIGISFYTFHGLSYVIDVFRKRCAVQRDPLIVALYISLFPQLIAGPIVRYVDVKDELKSRRTDVETFGSGVRLFVIGLAKKMIIANAVARPADAIFGLPSDELTGPVAWLGVVCYGLQIYFDFSAYSDMALGLGRMFGIHFHPNFNYPYISQSITEFWRRWHISLSTWFRDYLYIPLGGNRVSSARVYLNLMIVFFLCGLWHGASWNFVFWGMYHGFLLILERFKLSAWLEKLPRPLRHAYVLLLVLIGWVPFRADTFTSTVDFFGAMLGFAQPALHALPVSAYLDPEIMIAIMLGIVGSTPILHTIATRLRTLPDSMTRFAEAFEVMSVMGTFVYCTMLIAAGSYSPFIYFRF